MKSALTITISQADIDAAEPCNEFACPIANAVRRAGYRRPTVKRNLIVSARGFAPGYANDFLRITRKLPDTAREFIRAFDNGEMVKPFSFEIRDLPDSAKR